jgi:hypothetical protein
MATAVRKKATRKVARRASTPSRVQMLLNGQNVGEVDPSGLSISQCANNIARENGLKSYSILINGTKVGTEEAGKPLSGARTIEVFAKETRG